MNLLNKMWMNPLLSFSFPDGEDGNGGSGESDKDSNESGDQDEKSLADMTDDELTKLKESDPDKSEEIDAILAERAGEEGEGNEEELDEKSKSKVQKRIDELVAQGYEKDAVIEELKEQIAQIGEKVNKGEKKSGSSWDDWSDDELRALKTEKPEYAPTVEKILEQRIESRIEGKIKGEQSFKAVEDKAYASIEEKYPEFARKGTPEWKKANEIYLRDGLKDNPRGPLVAVLLAKEELGLTSKPKGNNKALLEKKLERERSKKDLASGKGGGTAPSSSKDLDKLWERAQGTREGSPEWLAYIRAYRASKK